MYSNLFLLFVKKVNLVIYYSYRKMKHKIKKIFLRIMNPMTTKTPIVKVIILQEEKIMRR